MHMNFVDPEIKIFHDFQVLRPIPKIENLEIIEIHGKPENTEI